MPQSSEVTPGYLVWRLSMKWRAAADRAVAPLGLTQAQFSVLASLYGLTRSGWQPSQRELADYAALDPIFVSKLARTLEAAGLIRRAEHPADSRAVQLTLTDQGVDVAQRALLATRELQEELTAPLGGLRDKRTLDLIAALRILLGFATATDIPNQDRHSQDENSQVRDSRDADSHDTDSHDRSEDMAQALILTGQDIGVAANATGAVLKVLLDRSATSFPEWAALRSLDTRSAAPPERSAFEAFLAEALSVEPAEASSLLSEMEAKGQIGRDSDGRLELTPEGKAKYEELNAGVSGLATQIYGGIDEDDLAVAHRVLAEVTDRAKALRDQI